MGEGEAHHLCVITGALTIFSLTHTQRAATLVARNKDPISSSITCTLAANVLIFLRQSSMAHIKIPIFPTAHFFHRILSINYILKERNKQIYEQIEYKQFP